VYAQSFKDFEVVVVNDGQDLGETYKVCRPYPVTYIELNRGKEHIWRNPSYPNNVGIQQSKGEVIVLQNAECRHDSAEVVSNLVGRAVEGKAVLASVRAVKQSGEFDMWFTHPQHRAKPYFFCGAIRREYLEQLRGFDEDYTRVGFDDDDLADRLKKQGIEFVWDSDIVVTHQWHTPSYNVNCLNCEAMYKEKTDLMSSGAIGPVRNLEREWGKLGSSSEIYTFNGNMKDVDIVIGLGKEEDTA